MPPMPKSANAFRTISEVAEWLEIPAHVLRFWESKFAQIKPVKRAGGRRYYRPTDMLLIGGIKRLLHDDGMTIKGAQKILREQGVKHVSALSKPLDDTGETVLETPAPSAPAKEAAETPQPAVAPPATAPAQPDARTAGQTEAQTRAEETSDDSAAPPQTGRPPADLPAAQARDLPPPSPGVLTALTIYPRPRDSARLAAAYSRLQSLMDRLDAGQGH